MKNLLLIFRKLGKNKPAISLGITGMVVGMMCVVYIFLLVSEEIRYDRFHENLNRIFVVHAYLEGGTSKKSFRGCPPAVATALNDEYPEVKNTCRYIPPYYQYLVVTGEKRFLERTAFADFELFDIFSFPFVYGDKGDDKSKDRVVFTETAARRYFGNVNPVGKIVRMDNRIDMTITGVIKDIPENSSITFDAIIPLENIGFYYSRSDYLTSWYNNSFLTYGLLTHPEGFEKVASAITRRIQEEIPESTNYLRAYKFKNGYLYEQNHIRNVRIYSLIAFLVLLAATLNFVNLNTARSSNQIKETGLRKTFGASRINIARLIYTDMAMICLLVFGLAIAMVYIGLPLINRLTGKEIDFSSLFSLIPMVALLVIYLLTVLLAGSYPAFFLSSFSPGQILSSNFQTVRNRGIFRNIMVIVMFVISIILLTSTLVISKQTDYLRRMDLGFEADQLISVSLKGKLREQVGVLKQEIGRSPDVISSCCVAHLPVMIGNNGEGWAWEGKDPNFKPLVTVWLADEDLLKTLKAEMAEGDFISRNSDGIVINKTFANIIGWDSFEGRTVTAYGSQYRISGVVRDIHFNTLSSEVMPMVIGMVDNGSSNFLLVKVNSGNIGNTIDFVKKTCQNIEPSFPFEHSFLDNMYSQMLESEVNLKKLVSIFSVFAILVLCLGLLGMVLFLIEQKTKEIGIRKCLGENDISIIGKFIKPFLIYGISAGLIAIPITWYVMDRWLQSYAYRIQLNLREFIFSGILIIGIALITVFWQAWRAACKNPVEALRYE